MVVVSHGPRKASPLGFPCTRSHSDGPNSVGIRLESREMPSLHPRNTPQACLGRSRNAALPPDAPLPLRTAPISHSKKFICGSWGQSGRFWATEPGRRASSVGPHRAQERQSPNPFVARRTGTRPPAVRVGWSWCLAIAHGKPLACLSCAGTMRSPGTTSTAQDPTSTGGAVIVAAAEYRKVREAELCPVGPVTGVQVREEYYLAGGPNTS
jgi:hypothetical protein